MCSFGFHVEASEFHDVSEQLELSGLIFGEVQRKILLIRKDRNPNDTLFPAPGTKGFRTPPVSLPSLDSGGWFCFREIKNVRGCWLIPFF